MKIYSQSPMRISLIGGQTDNPEYAKLKGSIVVNASINLYQRLTLYTQEDSVGRKHILPEGADEGFANHILSSAGLAEGIIECQSDGVLGAGLGSSASFSIALISAIAKTQNMSVQRQNIAEAGIIAEKEMGWSTGKQDAYASCFGGVNVLEIGEKEVKVTPLARGFVEPLQNSLSLCYLGQRGRVQKSFANLMPHQIKAMDLIKEMTMGSLEYILKSDFVSYGKLLDMYWKEKKQTNIGISNKHIDNVYEYAKKNGALGGKLCGAGENGYMLFVVDHLKKQAFEEQMQPHAIPIDFSFEWTGVTTRII